MSIDFEGIERRIKDGIFGDDWLSDTTQYDACDALAVLLAEVERLRALEADAERARVKADLWNYYASFVAANGALPRAVELARDEARAAVVAWLRARSISIGEDHRNTTDDPVCWAEVALRGAANAIERGEHRNEGGE